MNASMQIPLSDPNGRPWNEDALHALGAAMITTGAADAITLSPGVDLSGYAAAVAAVFARVQASFKAQVDATAEALRLTLITPGSGQAMEYQEAYAEAVQVDQAAKANPAAAFDPNDFPMLSASLGYDLDPGTGKPTTDIPGEARAVLAAYDAYQKAGAAIRNARLKGKAAIDAASDAAAAEAAFAAIAWPKLKLA